MRLIFKNIWAHKSLNVWLFIEIVVISVLTWLFSSVVTEFTYYVAHFNNYSSLNNDNCVRGNVIRWSFRRDYTPEEDEAYYNNVQVIYNKLCEDPDFSSVTFDVSYSNINRSFTSVGNPDSKLVIRSYERKIVPFTNFFSTFGISSLTHNLEQLENIANDMDDHQIIISESLAQMLFGTTDVIGKSLFESLTDGPMNPDSLDQGFRYTIVDVVETSLDNVRDIFGYIVYKKTSLQEMHEESNWLTIRLRDGLTSEEFFAKRNKNDDQQKYHCGSFNDDATGAGITNFTEYGNDERRNTKFGTIATIFLSLFFINMFIGIVGTFWLQIRNRFQEISIQRSFGASRKRVIRSIISEGMVLAQLAVIVGAIVVLQFSDRVNGPISDITQTGLETNWMTNFWPHFLIVTVIVSIVIQFFVILGILIPAYFHTRKLLK